MEQSMGDRDDYYKKQSGGFYEEKPKTEEESAGGVLESINPMKEANEEKIRKEIEKSRTEKKPATSKIVFSEEIHNKESKRFKEQFKTVTGGKKMDISKEDPFTDDESWRRYKKKISNIRETQAEI